MQIYPNPVNTVLTVMNSRYPELVYRFYDVSGQQLLIGSLSNTMNTINVESYARGVYFLQLIDEASGDSITKKIIVNR